VYKHGESIEILPGTFKSISEFGDKFVTENRLKQGLQEVSQGKEKGKTEGGGRERKKREKMQV
jgi:hypothetical protein